MNATIKLENRIRTTIPDQVLRALARRRGSYSTIRHVFHCIQTDTDCWVGVAGDGDNGCYEFFCWKPDFFECTDVAYGSTEIALRYALNQYVK